MALSNALLDVDPIHADVHCDDVIVHLHAFLLPLRHRQLPHHLVDNAVPHALAVGCCVVLRLVDEDDVAFFVLYSLAHAVFR